MREHGTTREEAESSDERFERIADAAPALLWMTETDGSCSFLSKGWYDYTGQSIGDALGFGWLDAVHPEDRERALRSFLDANRKREAFTLDHRVRRTDGQYRWVMDAGRPRFSDRGEFLGYVGSVIDVHERRQAELERDRFFDLSVDMLAVASLADGRWRRVNPAFTRTLGWTEEDLLTMPFMDIVHPEDLDRSLRATEALAGGARLLNFEHRVRCRDGSYRWIAWSTAPQIDVGLMHCVGRDITERIRSEEAMRESEERFRMMADGLPLIVWVHDDDGAQEMVNATFCEYFGVKREEMKGGRWQMLMHEDDADAYADEFSACLRERRPFHARVRVKRADGQWRWLESWGRPCFTSAGEFRGFVGTSADVTEQIESEQALRESDRRKEEFLAVLGHELRNPLAPLRSGLELISQAPTSPELAESVHAMMERQLSHLTHLVDDLLDVSRISRGDIELQRAPLDLTAVIEAAVEQVQPLVTSRSHRLTVRRAPAALPIDGDFQRLTQIVFNLLSNAAKYTDKQGRITLRTEIADGQAIVRVRDNGYGIPPDQLDEIFEMFSQVDIHRARTGGGGLGIGLALSRRLAAMHGGSIEARSDGVGKGSEFILRVPLRASTTAAVAAASAAQDTRPSPRRVLVVDDNVDAAETLKALLNMQGHSVEVAHDGFEALQALETSDPEVVLLDIGLPEMDGYEVARRIRGTARGRNIQLIALTGWGQAEDKRRARDAGFDEHLTKPVNAARLGMLIASEAKKPRDGEDP